MAVEGLSARLYLDHNVHSRLEDDLRHFQFDVISAREVGRGGAADEDHLRWAAVHGRVIVTFDRKDFVRLATAWAERGEEHAGIIVAVAPPRLSYSELLQRLLNLLDVLTADDLANRLVWLDESWSLER